MALYSAEKNRKTKGCKMNITPITFDGEQYTFTVEKTVYRCTDKPSLEEIRQELIKQRSR